MTQTPLLSQSWEAFSIVAICFITALLGPLVVRLCRKKVAMDTPNERSSHTIPTPRGGGVLMVALWLPLAAVIWTYYPVLDLVGFLPAFLLMGLWLAIIGWVDDRSGLHPLFRLLMQIFSVGLALYFMPPVAPSMGFDVPLIVEKIVLTLGWLWFINLFNFMDGMDGLATSEAAFISLALSFLVPELRYMALALMAVNLGFLRVNVPNPRAQVFMGDVGSTFLGYILGGFFIMALYFGGTYYGIVCLVVSLVFVADATYTLTKRLLKGKKPWHAHNEHWYQRAYQLGLSHWQVLWRVMVINLCLGALALWGYATNSVVEALVVGLVILMLAAVWIRRMEGRSF